MQAELIALCECGCGEPAPISDETRPSLGYVKGQPRRFRAGHFAKLRSKNLPEYTVNPETGCWEWQRFIAPDGYGHATYDGQLTTAHRALWQRQHGPLPAGMDLHHRCENKSCVNPDHLKTLARAPHKQRHSVLSDEDVRAIRATPKVYGSGRRLAQRYGVTDSVISQIRNGKSWVSLNAS